MRRAVRAAAATLLVLAATVALMVVPGPAVAAPCTVADAPPQVVDVTADDVALPPDVGEDRQDLRVTVQNACGGTSSYSCAVIDTSCTGLTVRLQRTGAPTGPAASCAHGRTWEDVAVGARPGPTDQPGTYAYDARLLWAFDDDGDGFGPRWSDACAGAWDVVVTPFNTTEVDGTRTDTAGSTVVAPRVFSVLRWSRASTDATPEPVRRGHPLTVRGRVTRQVLEGGVPPAGTRFLGYAGAAVVLQSRLSSGGAFHDVRTVRTNAHGYLTTSLTAPSSDHCYRWVFRGSSTTRRVVSVSDCVHVTR